jgi:hypothetical protein
MLDASPPPNRIQRFFTPLLERNPSGIDWLPPLLRATPAAEERLGGLIEDAGSLDANLTLPALEGRRTAFRYPVAAPPGLSRWLVDHPARLTWADGGKLKPEVRLLRRALVLDEPPGSRAKAQSRARDLIPVRSAFSEEWWRFEETFWPDMVLKSSRLALTFVAAERTLDPVSEWYPQRSVLVRALEAAERLADERRWGTIVLSEVPIAGASDAALRDALAEAAPHRTEAERAQLADAYLGNLTWDRAATAVAPVLAPR